MSDSTGSGREWRFYVEDMIAFASKCLAYTEGMDQYSFVSSALTYDATLRNLELIGEAATRLPDEAAIVSIVAVAGGGGASVFSSLHAGHSTRHSLSF